MRNKSHNKKLPSYLAILTFLLMILINLAANLVPLAGVKTSQVSSLHQTLITPADFTFGIWFLIYILLALYTLYQMQFNLRRPDNNDRVVRRVNYYFIVTNILNSGWILSWHYQLIGLSLMIMVTLFIILWMIRRTISNRSSLNDREVRSIAIPFSIYYSWILFAMFSNLLVFYDTTKYPFGLARLQGSLLALGVYGLLVSISIIGFKDIFIGLVALWSGVGIVIPYLQKGQSSKFNELIVATGIIIIIILVSCVFVYINRKRKKSRYRRR